MNRVHLVTIYTHPPLLPFGWFFGPHPPTLSISAAVPPHPIPPPRRTNISVCLFNPLFSRLLSFPFFILQTETCCHLLLLHFSLCFHTRLPHPPSPPTFCQTTSFFCLATTQGFKGSHQDAGRQISIDTYVLWALKLCLLSMCVYTPTKGDNCLN
ncbi:unnamed protein product [Acanthosepion pharaonis]|uniref:Uncharacterized protein n=1 Tax=Acanthosepion pharaonis TaxID=158019 RepID=A0A812EGM0_ACAPH|nr:unnamed protein product [Sepia pharaonis]